MITSAELRFAQLKLAAFAALAGWGTPGEPVKIGEREFETTKPNSFERHTQLADRLVLWALMPSAKPEQTPGTAST
jgi:hypothetical protein